MKKYLVVALTFLGSMNAFAERALIQCETLDPCQFEADSKYGKCITKVLMYDFDHTEKTATLLISHVNDGHFNALLPKRVQSRKFAVDYQMKKIGGADEMSLVASDETGDQRLEVRGSGKSLTGTVTVDQDFTLSVECVIGIFD